MFFDFNDATLAGEVIVFPSFPYAGVPVAPSGVGETITIGGSAGNSPSIGGSVDNEE